MIVTAQVDRSEGGRTALPEGPETVLVYAGDGSESDHYGLDPALAAIARCRLIREGHVFSTEIQHGVSTFLTRYYTLGLDDDGEVVER